MLADLAALALAGAAAWVWRWRELAAERGSNPFFETRFFRFARLGITALAVSCATFGSLNWSQSARSAELGLGSLAAASCVAVLLGVLAGLRVRCAAPGDRRLWRFAQLVLWGVPCLLLCATLLTLADSRFRPGADGFPRDAMSTEEIAFLTQHTHTVAPELIGQPLSASTRLGQLRLDAVVEREEGVRACCWMPDGTPLCAPSRPRPAMPASERQVFFSFQGDVAAIAAAGPHYECIVTTPQGEQGCPRTLPALDPNLDGMKGLWFWIPPDATTARLRLGVPDELWSDTDAAWQWTGDATALEIRSIRRASLDWTLGVTSLREGINMVEATAIAPPRRDAEVRLVAVDSGGEVRLPVEHGKLPFHLIHTLGKREESYPTVVQFHDLLLPRLKELRFQIRSFRWVEFQRVSLQPGVRTEPITARDDEDLLNVAP